MVVEWRDAREEVRGVIVGGGGKMELVIGFCASRSTRTGWESGWVEEWGEGKDRLHGRDDEEGILCTEHKTRQREGLKINQMYQ